MNPESWTSGRRSPGRALRLKIKKSRIPRTLMRLADPREFYLVCRCCGCGIHADIDFRNGIPRLAWGSMQTCPHGCTLEMLRARLEAEHRGREEAKHAAEIRRHRRNGVPT